MYREPIAIKATKKKYIKNDATCAACQDVIQSPTDTLHLVLSPVMCSKYCRLH